MLLRIRNLLVLVALFLGLTAGDCTPKETPVDGGGPTSDGAAGTGTACYVADQFRCKEFPTPTDDQRNNLMVECSSASGALAATCPMGNFKAKCTVAAAAGTRDSPEVRRWYTGRDVAYEQSFCASPAMGVWSTTF